MCVRQFLSIQNHVILLLNSPVVNITEYVSLKSYGAFKLAESFRIMLIFRVMDSPRE